MKKLFTFALLAVALIGCKKDIVKPVNDESGFNVEVGVTQLSDGLTDLTFFANAHIDSITTFTQQIPRLTIGHTSISNYPIIKNRTWPGLEKGGTNTFGVKILDDEKLIFVNHPYLDSIIIISQNGVITPSRHLRLKKG